jgi:hypothetical protein
MKYDIGDEAAIKFSDGFYDAIFAGKEFKAAYAFGRNAIRGANIAEHRTPLLQMKEPAIRGKGGRSGRHPEIRAYLQNVPRVFAAAKLFPAGFVSPLMVDHRAPGQPGEDARRALRSLICTAERSYVLLLGDYGAGKTSLCLQVAHDMAVNALTAFPTKPIPFYLNLGYSSAKSNENLLEALAASLNEDYGSRATSADLENLVREHDITFFLDGLDEMVDRVNFEGLDKVLKKIDALAKLSPRLRIVVTCRETFFQSPLHIGLVPSTHRYLLLPFDDRKLKSYFRGWGPQIATMVEAVFAANGELRNIARIPIHALLLARYLSRQRARKSPTANPLSILELYDSFIEESVGRNPRDVGWPLSERFEAIVELAFRWLQDNKADAPLAEFEDFVRSRLAPEEKEFHAKERQRLIRRRARFLVNCSFFQRIAQSERYRFVHRSFQEYFVADGMVTGLLANDVSKWCIPMYSEIFDFCIRSIRRLEFPQVMIDSIFKRKYESAALQFVAQGNFLAAIGRWQDDRVKALFREQLASNPYVVVRQVAAQGLGLYPADENIDFLLKIVASERNTVLRETCRKILARFARDPANRKHQLFAEAALVGKKVSPVTVADAAEILDAVGGGHQGIRNTCRRAMVSSGSRWTSVVGSIYLLGAIGDEASHQSLYDVARQSREPEVRQTYREIQALNTFGRPLPKLAKP